MAKWGEGDPRWIVEERADATNVNNWHWTEKNATQWSKDKFKVLLKGMEIENDKYDCKVTDLTSIEGEASASNRKAKLIFFYEWVLKLEWSGTIIGLEKSHKGKIEIPNLSDENDAEDIDIIVSLDSQNDDSYQLKQFMHKIGSEKIREQLATYIKDLKMEFSKGMVLPTGKDAKVDTKQIDHNIENKLKEQMASTVINSASASKHGVKIPCKKLTDTIQFKCQAEALYRALTDKDMVSAFTRDGAQLVNDKGAPFVLFGGNIHGEFTQLEPNTLISMRWRFKSWPTEHYSTVTLKITEKEDETELQLTQTEIPDNDYTRTKEGWHRYYWEPIKQTFGFGARLF